MIKYKIITTSEVCPELVGEIITSDLLKTLTDKLSEKNIDFVQIFPNEGLIVYKEELEYKYYCKKCSRKQETAEYRDDGTCFGYCVLCGGIRDFLPIKD